MKVESPLVTKGIKLVRWNKLYHGNVFVRYVIFVYTIIRLGTFITYLN